MKYFHIILMCGFLCLPACNPDPIGKTYAVKDGNVLLFRFNV